MSSYIYSQKFLAFCFMLFLGMSIAFHSNAAEVFEKNDKAIIGTDFLKTTNIHEQKEVSLERPLGVCNLTAKIAGGSTGIIPSLAECPIFFVYGVGALTSVDSLGASVLAPTIIAIRIPTHISRVANLWMNVAENVTELKKQHHDYWQIGLTAKITHAVINYTFPMAYMVITAEKNFLQFAALTVPMLGISNFAKGIENLAPQTVSSKNDNSSYQNLSYCLISFGALTKGLFLQQLVEKSFPAETDETVKFYTSWGIGLSSAALTYYFDQEKIVRSLQRLVENPPAMVLSTLQAGLVTSVYYGLCMDLGIEMIPPTLVAGTLFAFETVIEAASVDYNFTKLWQCAKWCKERVI